MKIGFTTLGLLLADATWFIALAGEAPSLIEHLRIRESKSVTANDAKFVVSTESDWILAKPGRNVPIEIQLRITNFGKSDAVFPMNSTFYIRIFDGHGKRIMPEGGRDHLIFVRPVVITSGASYSLCRRAEMAWDARKKKNVLVYWDGTGAEYRFGPLYPGRYKLSFRYSVPDQENSVSKIGNAVPWSGEVTTEETLIEVLESPGQTP